METPIQQLLVGLLQPFAFESVTIANAVKGLTLATHKPASGRRAVRAIITVETAQIRYRYDGGNPASDEGHILNPMSTLTVVGYEAMENIKFIRTGDNSGVIKVTYER